MPDNMLAAIAPSRNTELSTGLLGIENYLRVAAEANVANAGEGFTDAEVHAMVVVEELKLVNGMDLAAVLLRGKLLKEIEDGALWTFHPGQYITMQAMARAQGISMTEMSQIRSLYTIIFPFIENELHMSVSEIWEEIGKSNFFEMISVLRGIITGEQTGTDSVQASVERILNDTAATALAAEQPLNTVEEVRTQAVSNLIQAGQTMNNAELRNHVRPDRTPSIEPTIIEVDGVQYMIAEVSSDQRTMLNRLLRGHMEEALYFELPDDPTTRQIEAARVEILRRINSWTDGR